MKKCGGLDTLLQLLRRYERESREDFTHLQTAVALVTVINACITDNGVPRGGRREWGQMGSIRNRVHCVCVSRGGRREWADGLNT